jgi:hypothetical protein
MLRPFRICAPLTRAFPPARAGSNSRALQRAPEKRERAHHFSCMRRRAGAPAVGLSVARRAGAPVAQPDRSRRHFKHHRSIPAMDCVLRPLHNPPGEASRMSGATPVQLATVDFQQ